MSNDGSLSRQHRITTVVYHMLSKIHGVACAESDMVSPVMIFRRYAGCGSNCRYTDLIY